MLQIHAINSIYAINECGVQRVPVALPGWAVTLIENTSVLNVMHEFTVVIQLFFFKTIFIIHTLI